MPDAFAAFPVGDRNGQTLLNAVERRLSFGQRRWMPAFAGMTRIGDKSQLVCMTLAARYRPWPVLLGAIVAFAFLNGLAVVFGAAVAHWLPESVVLAAVGILFLLMLRIYFH